MVLHCLPDKIQILNVATLSTLSSVLSLPTSFLELRVLVRWTISSSLCVSSTITALCFHTCGCFPLQGPLTCAATSHLSSASQPGSHCFQEVRPDSTFEFSAVSCVSMAFCVYCTYHKRLFCYY